MSEKRPCGFCEEKRNISKSILEMIAKDEAEIEKIQSKIFYNKKRLYRELSLLKVHRERYWRNELTPYEIEKVEHWLSD